MNNNDLDHQIISLTNALPNDSKSQYARLTNVEDLTDINAVRKFTICRLFCLTTTTNSQQDKNPRCGENLRIERHDQSILTLCS